VCDSSVPTCCRLDFLFRAEFAMHRSLSAAIPARSMVITCAGLTEDPVAEVTFVLACALNDGAHLDALTGVLGEQLSLTRTHTASLLDLIERCGLLSYAATSRTCRDLSVYMVRHCSLL
jgi:hypothetical protein